MGCMFTTHAACAAVLDYCAGLTATAGQLAPWLDATEADSRELALDYAHRDFSGLRKLDQA